MVAQNRALDEISRNLDNIVLKEDLREPIE